MIAFCPRMAATRPTAVRVPEKTMYGKLGGSNVRLSYPWLADQFDTLVL
jgi:hypothetical protein